MRVYLCRRYTQGSWGSRWSTSRGRGLWGAVAVLEYVVVCTSYNFRWSLAPLSYSAAPVALHCPGLACPAGGSTFEWRGCTGQMEQLVSGDVPPFPTTRCAALGT